MLLIEMIPQMNEHQLRPVDQRHCRSIINRMLPLTHVIGMKRSSLLIVPLNVVRCDEGRRETADGDERLPKEGVSEKEDGAVGESAREDAVMDTGGGVVGEGVVFGDFGAVGEGVGVGGTAARAVGVAEY
mmetsp:Transcript_9870/g.12213  ORF Transcript_9870/g.12213 Transcript_9870/m.12213 type:complete len:130 (+) Transcript_9870:117-506(+)